MLTEEQANKLFDRFKAHCEHWIAALGLGGRYEIEVQLKRMQGGLEGLHQGTTVASSVVEWYDPEVTIRLHVDNLDPDVTDEWLELLALHEISHIIVAPMTSEGDDRTKVQVQREELTVEVLSRALRSSFQAGMNSVKGIRYG